VKENVLAIALTCHRQRGRACRFTSNWAGARNLPAAAKKASAAPTDGGRTNLRQQRFSVMKLPVCVLICITACGGALAQTAHSGWRYHEDREAGLSIAYPSQLFAPVATDDPTVHAFVSPDAKAKFLVAAWENTPRRTPEAFQRWLLDNGRHYDSVTYQPRGRSWFVLSGYHQDKIFYEKIMFTCSGEVLSIFAITYPIEQRGVYDAAVERMEDAFPPSQNC
jgi:hypothetical protein